MLAGRHLPGSTVTPTPSVAIVEATPQTPSSESTPQPTRTTEIPRQTAGQPPAGTNVADLFNQARSEADAEQNDKAVADYTEAIRLKADYAEAYNGLGAALMKLGKTDEAIGAFQSAATKDPKNVDALNNAGSDAS